MQEEEEGQQGEQREGEAAAASRTGTFPWPTSRAS